MTAEALIDTNVLVYAYDPLNSAKQERALTVLARLAEDNQGRVSAQILGEFVRVVTEKLARPLPAAQAQAQVADIAQAWPVLPITPLIVLEATRGVVEHRLAYWDAQVWATARLNQIPFVLSEDFQDGRSLDGVLFRNPFVQGFDLAAHG